MNGRKQLILILFLLALRVPFSWADGQPSAAASFAEKLSSEARVSILTHSPWNGAAYALFGHAAIRVKDDSIGLDRVFNYGIFDFNQPNFIARFALGDTDYMLGYSYFDHYVWGYLANGQSIDEQIIDLTQAEKQRVWEALYINALPENRVYRYNFFFDNCSTRLFEILEQSISAKIVLFPTPPTTFRELVSSLLRHEPWLSFGINIVLGSPADRLITEKEKLFLPHLLREAIHRATVIPIKGPVYKLEHSQRQLAAAKQEKTNANILSPLLVGIVLFVVALGVSMQELKQKKRTKNSRYFDCAIYLPASIAGTILFFLMFCSSHPCISPNWNILWINPLYFFPLFTVFTKKRSSWQYLYHFINFAVLTVFAIFSWWSKQQFVFAIVPYVFVLYLRSATQIYLFIQSQRR